MPRWSLAGRLGAHHAIVAAVASTTAALAATWLRGPIAGALAGLLAAIPVALWLARRTAHPWSRVLAAVRDGIVSLRDRDLSVSLGRGAGGELDEVVDAYNSLGDLLRRERFDLYQRELLLDTVIQTTPLVLVLTNATDRIVYSNIAARRLLRGGARLEGLQLTQLLADAPAPLRDSLARGGDTLFTMDMSSEHEVYHLSRRDFLLNAQAHHLILLKQLTRELAAQEVAVWKRVIRVIAHELNNSLAPISSLAHSGRMLVREPDAAQLERVFTTIAERAAHLGSFIEGYARFAKLPRPRPERIAWSAFLERLEGAVTFRIVGALPLTPATLDPSQMEQVIINLLKNAAESGSASEDITIAVREQPGGFVVEVGDRGQGLSENVLRDALLPFFSTKASGTGLGLTLCREIVEAHRGELSLANRPEGGALVTVWLPMS